MQSLDICENTSIKAYAHYVFACSIIEGNIKRSKTGRLLKLEVKEGNTKEWIQKVDLVKQTDSTFFIDKATTEPGMYEYVYRECDIEDELIVCVDELKNSRNNAILNLAFTWGDFEKSIVNNECSYKVGMIYNRILTRFNKNFLTNNAIVQSKEKYLRLSRKDNVISAYSSADGANWNLVETHDIGVNGAQCKIGFIAENLGDIDFSEQYAAWLNMNFVQTVYNDRDNGAVWLDYWNFPRKKCRYENVYFNSFLDIYYDEPSEIIALSGSLFDYVKWCLNHDYYIAVSMDEYYISGRSRYRKQHFFHHNMVYGVDFERKELYVIGYDKKIVKGVVSFEEFEAATKSTQGVMMRYKFVPCSKQLAFDPKVLIDNLKRFCYCEGRDSRFEGICADEGVYGIKGLYEMAATERGKRLIVFDNRISFFLYEYCSHNEARVDYLERNGYLIEDEMVELKTMCAHMIDSATQLKNLVIKNEIKPVYAEQILEIYQEVCCSIMGFYKKLISSLEKKWDIKSE